LGRGDGSCPSELDVGSGGTSSPFVAPVPAPDVYRQFLSVKLRSPLGVRIGRTFAGEGDSMGRRLEEEASGNEDEGAEDEDKDEDEGPGTLSPKSRTWRAPVVSERMRDT